MLAGDIDGASRVCHERVASVSCDSFSIFINCVHLHITLQPTLIECRNDHL